MTRYREDVGEWLERERQAIQRERWGTLAFVVIVAGCIVWWFFHA